MGEERREGGYMPDRGLPASPCILWGVSDVWMRRGRAGGGNYGWMCFIFPHSGSNMFLPARRGKPARRSRDSNFHILL